MTKEELAAQLNDNEYPLRPTKVEEKEWKDAGLIVAVGVSDDLLELHGAIYDDFSAYNGTTIKLTDDGEVPKNLCEDYRCPYFKEELKKCRHTITAEWDKDGYSWVITSNLPFAPFDIMEDGEKFCRGIVVELPK